MVAGVGGQGRRVDKAWVGKERVGRNDQWMGLERGGR